MIHMPNRKSPDRLLAAAQERKRRLKALRDVVKVCECTWPLDVMRNRTGHADECPAHVRLASRYGNQRH